jgi:hypothetical protein
MKYSALELGLDEMLLLDYSDLYYDEDCDYDHDFTNDDLYELPF